MLLKKLNILRIPKISMILKKILSLMVHGRNLLKLRVNQLKRLNIKVTEDDIDNEEETSEEEYECSAWNNFKTIESEEKLKKTQAIVYQNPKKSQRVKIHLVDCAWNEFVASDRNLFEKYEKYLERSEDDIIVVDETFAEEEQSTDSSVIEGETTIISDSFRKEIDNKDEIKEVKPIENIQIVEKVNEIQPEEIKIIEETEIEPTEEVKEEVQPIEEVKTVEEIKEEIKPVEEVKVIEEVKEEIKPAEEVKVIEEVKEEIKPAEEVKVIEEVKEEIKPAEEVKKVVEEVKEEIKPVEKKKKGKFSKLLKKTKKMFKKVFSHKRKEKKEKKNKN